MFTACRPPELNLFGPDYNHPPVSNCKGLMLCDRPITKYGENPVGDANLQRPTLRDAPKIVSLHHHQTKQRAVNMPGNKKVRDIKPISACYKGRFHLPSQVSSWFEYFLNIELAHCILNSAIYLEASSIPLDCFKSNLILCRCLSRPSQNL